MSSEAKDIFDLGNGLIMRRSSPEDADALAEFNAKIHGESDVDRTRLANWTRDLLTCPHPTFNADDFIIIEVSSTGQIVSSSCLLPQTWSYEGIEFGVGRPELIGTLPEYRGKGLVRAQFDELHKWCVERNMPVQVITGIPYFYRQFGYEMALNLNGGRTGFESSVQKLKEGETELFRIRPAKESDISFIDDVYKYSSVRHAINAVRDEALWNYEITGRSEESIPAGWWEIIERVERDEPVGFLMRPKHSENHAILYELKQNVSWMDVTPSVIRYLWKITKELTAQDNKSQPSFTFLLGEEHPVHQMMGNDLPLVRKPYAYFVRVPDLIGFIYHITPALEQRLASSIAVRHSGELKLNFYISGLNLKFEKGNLTSIDDWKPSTDAWGDAAFPDLTFLQMLFGYRSYAELRQSYADCWCGNESNRALLDILFPKKPSAVLGIA
ncbi:MAG TPA: GNAT family N-acetyltransferase [Anaerolineales bacterium]|nr:GNAT family N-acetyltransferase [Anaerolineales bacterium]